MPKKYFFSVVLYATFYKYLVFSLKANSMKIRYFFSITLIFSIVSCNDPSPTEENATYPDGGFPEKILHGSGLVRTQSEVESFGALNYTIITGTLKIDPNQATNDFITDLTPLRSIERIERTLIITDNPELESLEGLHNVNWIGQILIQDNPNLISIDGLRNLNNVEYSESDQTNGYESSIWIRNNTSLLSIDALQNISSVKYITIANNQKLINLNGLSGLTYNYYFRTDIGCGSQPYVAPYCGNENLVDFCGLQNLFLNGNYEYVRILGNAYNPTVQDIIDGNCSQ